MKTLEQAALVTFKRVLLATDLSPSSEMALQYARVFGREPGVQIYTLHVSGPDNYQLLCPEAFSDTFSGRRESPRCDRDVLASLLQGLPCEVPLHGNKVWEVIADVVARNEIQLLILGTHGRKGLQKLLFGSVAEEVFRNVGCAVLTVGSEAGAPGASALAMRRALLATDFNPQSAAPMHAVSICEQFNAGLHLLHVAAKKETAEPGELWSRLRDQIMRTAPQVVDLERRPVLHVEYGEPASKILCLAEELDASIIVLGAHHPRDTRTVSHLPWATASQVVSRAKCPVLTVRDREVE
jgi:nucleotide-binding universal stress UspA family protein